MHKIRSLFSSLRAKLRKSPVTGYSLIVLGVGIFSFVCFIIVEANTPGPNIAPPTKIAPRVAEKFYSPLNGAQVSDEAATKQPITAVMIENSPDARPQSGLADAEVIYEAIAEGGITRFLTLFQQNKPTLVGPVRSLRMYYVDWLTPYQPSVAHVGGSQKALETVRNGSYRDIDQFHNPAYYWRASDRYAPHNVYTSFEKLDALNKEKGYTESVLTGLERQDAPNDKQATATQVVINFSSAAYNTVYTFNPDSNTYKRSYAIGPHTDREKGDISPSVVIAMKTTMQAVTEDGYRESIQTTGTGEAVIFQNGGVIEATWKKADQKSQLVFVDKDDKPIKLNRGQTWISAVPINQSGSVSWQ